jgi:hypothetical protein
MAQYSESFGSHTYYSDVRAMQESGLEGFHCTQNIQSTIYIKCIYMHFYIHFESLSPYGKVQDYLSSIYYAQASFEKVKRTK